MKKLGLAVLGLLALPALADNQQGFYAGIGGTSIKDYQDGVNNLSRQGAVEFVGGYKYNDALGVDIRLGTGKTAGTSDIYFDDQGTLQQGSLDRKINNYESIYYRPELVNDDAKLYALLGYTRVKSSVKIADANGNSVKDVSNSATGFSYGIGVSFVMDEHFNINFEYRNICTDISGKPNMIGVNVDYRF